MEKNYLTIDSRDFAFDVDVVRDMFGVAGEIVLDTFKEKNPKYAFFNTGNLCQVSYYHGGCSLAVTCFAPTDDERYSVLHWLKTYVLNYAGSCGFGVDFSFYGKERFFVRFYELAPETK